MKNFVLALLVLFLIAVALYIGTELGMNEGLRVAPGYEDMILRYGTPTPVPTEIPTPINDCFFLNLKNYGNLMPFTAYNDERSAKGAIIAVDEFMGVIVHPFGNLVVFESEYTIETADGPIEFQVCNGEIYAPANIEPSNKEKNTGLNS